MHYNFTQSIHFIFLLPMPTSSATASYFINYSSIHWFYKYRIMAMLWMTASRDLSAWSHLTSYLWVHTPKTFPSIIIPWITNHSYLLPSRPPQLQIGYMAETRAMLWMTGARDPVTVAWFWWRGNYGLLLKLCVLVLRHSFNLTNRVYALIYNVS